VELHLCLLYAGSWPTQVVLGVVYVRLDADHSPSSGVEVINEWNYTSAFYMLVHGPPRQYWGLFMCGLVLITHLNLVWRL